MLTFQEILRRLSLFWEKQGCIIHQGYDLEAGAGTFNPATFLRSLGPEPYRAAYVEPCRRPTDGRYGTNPNRVQHYFQYQVILKPSPANLQELYLQSLEACGLKLKEHDVRFVHDDWENPTIGACGLGWEVWMDGMEVTQYTYFQCVGGVELKPITAELTYGLERLVMYIQDVNSMFDLQWNEELTYGDIYHRNEVEWSHYNFEEASTEMWHQHFEDYEREAKKLMAKNLPIPAYDFIMKASHAFNMLDARGVISVTERTGYIRRIRDLARGIAKSYLEAREKLNYPLLKEKKSEVKEPKSVQLPKGSPDEKEDYLLEIGSEELPAIFVPIGMRNLEKAIRGLLDKEKLIYESIETYGAPRRLSVFVKGLQLGKAPEVKEKRGPKVAVAYNESGQISRPGEGFFRSLNMDPPPLKDVQAGSVTGVEVRDDYLYASVTIPGCSTADLLMEQLPKLIESLDFPKKMRWSDLDVSFARPLRWFVSLLGKEVIPFSLATIDASRTSFGHRQQDPEPFTIDKASDYLNALREHHVMASVEERKESITKQLEKEIDGKAICFDRVMPQVLHLSEWPRVTCAQFDSAFLRAPKEVLISEMVEHQKYFPVANDDGSLKNVFAIVCDQEPTDKIREGNQKVLSARLSDGVFLYEQDQKQTLDQLNEKLKHVTFQKELGSVFDKVLRIESNAEVLQEMLQISSKKRVKRAATLCKADLASLMVYEFPDLQGIIGKDYALLQGEDPEVASAIAEHWMPRGEGDALPESETGIILSLADKMDNLISCFSVGLKPTSSGDPHALRRQTLGIIKILIQGKYHFPIMKAFEACILDYPKSIVQNPKELLSELQTFITTRVKSVFQDYELSKDEIEASLSKGVADVYDAFCKVKALKRFRKEGAQFVSLFEVYKRAKGQINNQEALPFSSELLQEPAEKSLDQSLEVTKSALDQALTAHDYDEAYRVISKLQAPLAALFDEVHILADDPALRTNRIALLSRVFSLFKKLLDFSKIQER